MALLFNKRIIVISLTRHVTDANRGGGRKVIFIPYDSKRRERVQAKFSRSRLVDEVYTIIDSKTAELPSRHREEMG